MMRSMKGSNPTGDSDPEDEEWNETKILDIQICIEEMINYRYQYLREVEVLATKSVDSGSLGTCSQSLKFIFIFA